VTGDAAPDVPSFDVPSFDVPSFDVVVPTVGRPSLATLLDALAEADGPRPGRVLVVVDRLDECGPLAVGHPGAEVLEGTARGPAAARNVGWRASRADWVAFLDDDVVPDPDWLRRLASDLAGADPGVAGSQGRLRVPLPEHRPPTDWERNVAGLEEARWATADMAYRRDVLAEVNGFDEDFPRAFREDADVALRVLDAGYRLERGTRTTAHPVRPAGPWTSVRLQAGNADDALMRARHGPDWYERAGAGRGLLSRHVAVTAAGVAALMALAARKPSLALWAGIGWLAGTAELAWARVTPGPRTRREVATMTVTSAVVPAAATFHRLRGELRWRRNRPSQPGSAPQDGASQPTGSQPPASQPIPAAVLFDRDGTLVADVAYNGDPELVELMPGAQEAVERLRAAGVPTAVVSNQSGVGRGTITLEEVGAVNRRVEDLLGPLGPWIVCPHAPGDACDCRKPAPGMVLRAAEALGVPPARCALIGDIGADMEAARAAGARGVLVPTPVTRADEIGAAPEVATDLVAAVDLLLGDRP
jgi:histidinol-phosphate phosphatase family protein